MNISTVCICGGGGQCHAIAPWLSAQEVTVNILTSRPERWSRDFSYLLPDLSRHSVQLGTISADPAQTVAGADVVIVTVPGYANAAELRRIRPYLKPGAFVGGVFSSNGFFFDALRELGSEFPLWGFQRVPFIGKIKEYGTVGNIMAFKRDFQIAVENAASAQAEEFRSWVEKSFGQPTRLLGCHYEVSLSNSNPLLHPARIYTWLHRWDGAEPLKQNPLFYEEWPDDASEAYIALDADLHHLMRHLPMDPEALPYILDYYESTDPASLSRKLHSIDSFKGIRMPVREVEGGWLPDMTSRYFLEDFGCGLKNYRNLALQYGVDCPTIETIYRWGEDFINKYS